MTRRVADFVFMLRLYNDVNCKLQIVRVEFNVTQCRSRQIRFTDKFALLKFYKHYEKYFV